MFNLFRKEKEEKILPDNATTFQKLWHNKRTHAAMVLGIYFIFILILIIFINIAPKKEYKEGNKKISKADIWTMKDRLKESLYTFEYDIKVIEEEKEIYRVNYNGEKNEDGVSGYQEVYDMLIKYKIKDGIVYNVLLEETIELDIFYDKINANYLDLNYIFTMVRPRIFEIEKIDSKVEKYVYEEIILEEGSKTLNISIIANDMNITRIEIIEKKLIQKGKTLANEDFYIKETIYNLKYSVLSD